MTQDEDQSLLSVENFDDFVEGSSSKFSIEEGSYDGAEVVGYSIVKAEFEGKERKLIQLIWQFKNDDVVHTLRGNGWTISSGEKSKFRQEVSKWFDTTDWGRVCEILVKNGILVKDEGGKAHFELDKFIGKRGKLLIAEKTAKSGKKYAVISSISPCKKKVEFDKDSVPSFMVEGSEVLSYKLADGIQIRRKDDKKADVKINELPPAPDDKEEDNPF